MGSSIGEATGSRKGGRVKHFRPFLRSVCVSLSGADFFFFEKKRTVGGGLDCAQKQVEWLGTLIM